MKRHIAGKNVRGAVALELPVPDTCHSRGRTRQPKSVCQTGVNLRTLQNWEQHRPRPTGPARALLKIVASNLKAIKALHT